MGLAKLKANQNHKTVVIAGYVRVSTVRQVAEGDSLEAQQEAIRRHAARLAEQRGWKYELQFFVERGKSAKDQNRPQLTRLKRGVEKKEIDVVITCKLDRITRSLIDFTVLWAYFEEHGVELISIQENFETSSPMGKAMVMIIMIFAQLERELTGERTRATMQDRTRRGLWNGGFVLGYLRDNEGRLSRDPITAPVVQQLFDDFERLGSVGQVVKHHRGVGTRMPKRMNRSERPIGGKPLSKQQVSALLQNRVYLGELNWGDEQTANAHEPIIAPDQFDRVQVLLEKNRRTKSNDLQSVQRVFRLKGLVRCGCGNMMTPTSSTGRNGKHGYYVCTAETHSCGGQCKAPYQPAEALEEAVIERLCQLSQDEPARKQIIADALAHADDEALRLHGELAQIDRQIATVKGQIKNLVSVLAQLGAAGLDSVKVELAELEQEKRDLEAAKVRVELHLSRLARISADGRQFIAEWRNVSQLLTLAEPAEQQTLIQHLIDVVEVQPPTGDKKTGKYRLKLWADGPDEDESQPADPPYPDDQGELGDQPALTENGAVLQVDEKAPPVGLEPTTQRLTAACSTD